MKISIGVLAACLLIPSNAFAVRKLVRLEADGADDAYLARLGARVLKRTGSVVLAEVDSSRYAELSRGVSRLTPSKKLQLRLDSARAKAGVAPLAMERPDLTGEGVVVAVIDSGIDWTHETFMNEDGTTRIEAIWDLCDPAGPAPAGFEDYGGTLVTAAEINAANAGTELVRHRDVIGHGTFVSSIAAGRGRADDPSLAGMAPGASIMVAAVFGDETGCNNPFFDVESDASLTIALELFARLAHGRPISVNMSIGTESPFGDGVSLLESELTQWVEQAPARSIAIAAANSGHDYHYGFTLTRDEPSRVLHVDYLPLIYMSLSAEDRVRMRVKAEDEPCAEFPGPSSDTMQWMEYHGPTPLDRAGYTFSFASRDAAENLAVFESGEGEPQYLRSERACDRVCNKLASACGIDSESDEAYFCFDNCLFFNRDSETECATNAPDDCDTVRGCLVRRGEIEISLEEGVERARVDAWLTNFGSVRAHGAQHEMSIGDPAGAKGILAAGTYVQRDETVVPGLFGPADGAVGDLAGYSSRGPTIDGRLGVALAAPGELITAAVSSFSGEAEELRQIPGAVEGWGSWNGGTSAGAPILAGVAALLLQAHPEISSRALREAMLLGATRDSFTGPKPNPNWGFGKVDARASLFALQVERRDADGDGYTNGGLDCDDQNAQIHPEAVELADGIDNDCDEEIDEELPDSNLTFEALAADCTPIDPPPVMPPPVEPPPATPPPPAVQPPAAVPPPASDVPIDGMPALSEDAGGCSCSASSRTDGAGWEVALFFSFSLAMIYRRPRAARARAAA